MLKGSVHGNLRINLMFRVLVLYKRSAIGIGTIRSFRYLMGHIVQLVVGGEAVAYLSKPNLRFAT